jgi:hypothetical protein
MRGSRPHYYPERPGKKNRKRRTTAELIQLSYVKNVSFYTWSCKNKYGKGKKGKKGGKPVSVARDRILICSGHGAARTTPGRGCRGKQFGKLIHFHMDTSRCTRQKPRHVFWACSFSSKVVVLPFFYYLFVQR